MLSFQLKSAEGLLQEPQECREQPDQRAGGWRGRLLRPAWCERGRRGAA